MSQEIRREEGTPEPGRPWQSINFSNCYPINNTPVAKGAQADGQPLKPKYSFPLQGKKEPPRVYLCVRRSLFPLLK